MENSQANKCTRCKKFPMIVGGSGTVICTRCKMTGTSVKDWNNFMKPTDLSELVSRMERPLYVLKAVPVFSTDKGLRALAATTLKSIGELEFSEFISNPAEAEKLQAELEELKI